ncbi:MAG TPA: dihydrofolate reductase family protein [Friedmanniella sp.]
MSAADQTRGKVVVNRAMSVDGFIAGPDDDMGWIFEHLASDPFPEVMAATGAMLAGRRTQEVGERMADGRMAGEQAGYDGGPVFVLSHRPPAQPRPGVTYLSGGLADAVATARAAAGSKDLEILGADLASQCLRAGLVDEVLVYVLPVLLGDGVRLSTPGLGRVDLEPFETRRSGAVTLLRFRVRR